MDYPPRSVKQDPVTGATALKMEDDFPLGEWFIGSMRAGGHWGPTSEVEHWDDMVRVVSG